MALFLALNKALATINTAIMALPKVNIVTPKDIARINGCCMKKAYRIYRDARKKYKKTKKHHVLTLEELCRYLAIPLSQVQQAKPRLPSPKPKGPRPL